MSMICLELIRVGDLMGVEKVLHRRLINGSTMLACCLVIASLFQTGSSGGIVLKSSIRCLGATNQSQSFSVGLRKLGPLSLEQIRLILKDMG